ncbi:hypothetical protein FEM48_Zijuj05G0017200 [Ziziphus jujuba var. spinosa]|uniref:Uncharacterized protein n=1 Tax=Ziziphus jujuba var. spinosa TaxID=714518 RepID=A0A978VC29_ZIZJJ|nr:hypothetical protein FEM48_Zijuj05G0017200 [Ziziphus jujuba var. spinosa]
MKLSSLRECSLAEADPRIVSKIEGALFSSERLFLSLDICTSQRDKHRRWVVLNLCFPFTQRYLVLGSPLASVLTPGAQGHCLRDPDGNKVVKEVIFSRSTKKNRFCKARPFRASVLLVLFHILIDGIMTSQFYRIIVIRDNYDNRYDYRDSKRCNEIIIASIFNIFTKEWECLKDAGTNDIYSLGDGYSLLAMLISLAEGSL